MFGVIDQLLFEGDEYCELFKIDGNGYMSYDRKWR
jgi:hypothetical protein